MDGLLLVLIIVLAVAVAATVIILFVLLRTRRRGETSEIHYSGGANVDDGRLIFDRNYFRGMSSSVKTIAVSDASHSKNHSAPAVRIINRSTGQSSCCNVQQYLTFGRSVGPQMFTVSDSGASRMHCMLVCQNGRMLLSDLQSSNHTYLNGKLVLHETEIHSGDVIRIGKTELEIRW